MKKNNEITCAVCGERTREHGDGLKIPKTTCLRCYAYRMKQNKIDKELEKQKEIKNVSNSKKSNKQ